jgi:hypothetical protein
VREYNKLKKHLKHQFFSSFIDEINNIAPRDSKQFWQSLKKIKKRQTVSDSKVLETFYSSGFLLNSCTKVKIKVEFPVFMNSFNIKSVHSFLPFFSRFIPFFISLQLKGKSKGEGV